jgi:hypothetical protein
MVQMYEQACALFHVCYVMLLYCPKSTISIVHMDDSLSPVYILWN